MIERGRLLFRAWALKLADRIQRLAGGRDRLDVFGDAPVGSPRVSAQSHATPRGGPPPHWVERVRGAAPHLLRPGPPTSIAPTPFRDDPPALFNPRPPRTSQSEAEPARGEGSFRPVPLCFQDAAGRSVLKFRPEPLRERSQIERRKGDSIPEIPAVSESTRAQPFVASPGADRALEGPGKEKPARTSKRDEAGASYHPARELPDVPASMSDKSPRASTPLTRRRANWLRLLHPQVSMPARTGGESPPIFRGSLITTHGDEHEACATPGSRTTDDPGMAGEHPVRRPDSQIHAGTRASDAFAPASRSGRSIEVIFHERPHAQLGLRRAGASNQRRETQSPLAESGFGSEPSNSSRPRPDFPELPVRQPEDVMTAGSQETHWAELPPVPSRDPRDDWLERAREQEHQTRLDREQKGAPWTA